ncbi:MAG: thymidine kinase [Rhizobiales bacterium]|nr:thymidine kinase [Hyphomicrobiales bacterium]NRB14028.1 thymidine kinase [Hyphomicrobiales bacterium]
MAKLYFSFSAMNAGKSTTLLQAAHNYRERGMEVILYTAAFDDRAGVGKIASRIGLDSEAKTYDADSDLFAEIKAQNAQEKIDCILIDEAQFLTEAQVWQVAEVADTQKIPVMCYGLRTDFQGKLFPGSAALLAIADNLREIKTICWCGRKASMVLRLDANGAPIVEGEQVVIGGQESYESVCRRHWTEKRPSKEYKT